MSHLSIPSPFFVALLLLSTGLQLLRMRGDCLPLRGILSETLGALRANAFRFTLLVVAACLPAVIAAYLGQAWRPGVLKLVPAQLETTALVLYSIGLLMLPGLFSSGVMAHHRGERLERRPNLRRGLTAVGHGLWSALFCVGMLGAVAAVATFLLGVLVFTEPALLLPGSMAILTTIAVALAPGLYLAARLFVALPVAALKRVRVIQGLGESGRLTRGNSSSIALLLVAALCLLGLGSTLLGHLLPPGGLRYTAHLVLVLVLMIPLSASTTVVYARLVGEPGNVSAADLAQTFE